MFKICAIFANKPLTLAVSIEMTRLSRFFLVTAHSKTVDLGLFILRVGTSILMLPHGLSKLKKLNDPGDFYDFLGLGSEISLLLIMIAELFCSILLILGLGTRAIVIPLMIGMIVVAFFVNGPSIGEKEKALLFLIPYVTLFITGPGKHSLDYLFFGRKMLDAEARAKLYF